MIAIDWDSRTPVATTDTFTLTLKTGVSRALQNRLTALALPVSIDTLHPNYLAGRPHSTMRDPFDKTHRIVVLTEARTIIHCDDRVCYSISTPTSTKAKKAGRKKVRVAQAAPVIREEPVTFAGLELWMDMLGEVRGPSLLRIKGIVKLAETRIATECPIAGLHDESTATTTTGQRLLDRPSTALAIRYVSMLIPGTGTRQLKARPSDWLLQYWPDQDSEDVPKYWASFDASSLALAPTPDAAYAVTIGYRAPPTGLSASNEDNYLGTYHYDLLLWACCVEGATYLIDDRRQSMIDRYQAKYQDARQTLLNNERMTLVDNFSQTRADER